jgi:hypothetical protein
MSHQESIRFSVHAPYPRHDEPKSLILAASRNVGADTLTGLVQGMEPTTVAAVYEVPPSSDDTMDLVGIVPGDGFDMTRLAASVFEGMERTGELGGTAIAFYDFATRRAHQAHDVEPTPYAVHWNGETVWLDPQAQAAAFIR